MKKTLLTIGAAAMIAAAYVVIGCKPNSGLVFIDYDYAEKNGIVVTNFVDNPFVATIKYDYSKISEFSPNNLEVMLVKNVIPPSVWSKPNPDLSRYTEKQIALQKKLISLTTVDNKPIIDTAPRKASIKESTPGCLKIYCADDIGVYQINYKK